MTHRIRLLPLVIGVSYGLTAHAQEGAPTATPAEACFSLENDAARLACYDAALGRSAADTRRADEEAVAAKEAEAAARAKARADARAAAEAQDQDLALSERTRRRLGAWFRVDEAAEADLIANAGRVGITITPEHAIRWLTDNPAKAMGILEQTGTLEAGKMADVVLWNGNPFSSYAQAEQVYVDGARVYDRRDPSRQPKSDFLLGQDLMRGGVR